MRAMVGKARSGTDGRLVRELLDLYLAFSVPFLLLIGSRFEAIQALSKLTNRL